MSFLTTVKTLQTIDDPFDFQTYRDDKEKTWDVDPLILAVSAKDLADRTGHFYSLEGNEVRNNVNEIIVERSEEIRKYYSKKFFWRNLSTDRPLTPYRQRLCFLLETRSLTTVDRDQGIYFKLPWFYDEDMIYDDFKKTLITQNLPRIDFKVQPVAKRLEYIKTTVAWQHKRKLKRLWFKDEVGYLHGMEISADNPLLETFQDLLTEKTHCTFITRISEDRVDGMYFYKLHNFKLIKEK
jgi:hypothetical protein